MTFRDKQYYENSALVAPDDHIPFSQKDEKWHLKMAEYIYSRYVSDECGISFSKKSEMIRNKEYGEGRQDPAKYETLFYEWDEKDAEKAAWINLDKTILPIIPIYRNAYIGMMTDISHRIQATAIDPFSVKKKQYKKSSLWFRKMFEPEIREIDKKLGLPEKDDVYMPESKEELNMFFELGGYKLNDEAAIEAACNHCFHISKWDQEIANRVYADFFYYNIGSAMDYLDKETLMVKQRYVNPINLIVENSDKLDFGDSRFFGEIRSWDLIDIKIATKGQPGWDEERYQEIGRHFAGKNTNNTFSLPGDYNQDDDLSKPYHRQKIIIADLVFASIFYDYDTVLKNKYGNERLTKKRFGKVYNDEKRKTIVTGTKVWHKCKWIVGTPYIFEYGMQNDIPRPDLKDAKSSYHVYRIPGLSKAELCIGHADQAQLMYLQLQNHISKASPPGLAIEWNAIKEITLNSRERDPYEILKLKTQRGDIVYKLTTKRGHMHTPSTVPPIMELKGGFSENIIRVVELMEHHKIAIADIIGIPKPTATGQTEKYKSATIAKMAAIGTDKTLKTIYNGYISIFERSAENCIARLRDLLTYSDDAKEVYKSIIGDSGVDSFETFKDYSSPAYFSIKIEASPSDEDIENIRAMAMAAMKPTKNGVQIFSYGDFLLVERLIKAGNIKYIHAFITYKEHKAEKMDIIKEKEMMKENRETAVTQENTKHENQKDIETHKINELIRLKEKESDLAKDEETQKHEHEKELLDKQLKLKENKPQAQSA